MSDSSDLNDWDVLESEGNGKIRVLTQDELDLEESNAKERKNFDMISVTKGKKKIRSLTEDELDLEEIDARERKNSDLMAVANGKRKIRALTEDEMDLEEISARERNNSDMMATKGKGEIRVLTEDELDLEEIGAREKKNSGIIRFPRGKDQIRVLTKYKPSREEKLIRETCDFPFDERETKNEFPFEDREIEEAEIEERKNVISVSSSQSMVSCRICKYEGGPDLLPSPCHCKGTMGNVHLSCLEEWLQGSARDSCELCGFPFQVIRTRRYNAVQAACLYLRHHVRPLRLLRDLFLLGVSLSNSCLLMYMWLCRLMLAVILVGRREVELSAMLSVGFFKSAAYFSFFTLCLSFVAVNAADDLRRMFLMYLRPWYHWWQTTADVHLVLAQTTEKTN